MVGTLVLIEAATVVEVVSSAQADGGNHNDDELPTTAAPVADDNKASRRDKRLGSFTDHENASGNIEIVLRSATCNDAEHNIVSCQWSRVDVVVVLHICGCGFWQIFIGVTWSSVIPS
jgi:hypothetical protein